MPKEITHWTVAEKAYLRLEIGSVLRSIIKDHKNLYLTGAVIPDTPFYLFYGRQKKTMYDAAEKLHNHPSNSSGFGARVIDHYRPQVPDMLIAPLLGAITHIYADSSFHPMVYYFSGKRNPASDKASREAGFRHHTLETFLDLFFMGKYPLDNKGLFSNILSGIEMDKRRFLDLLSIVFQLDENQDAFVLKKALWMHRTIQSMFDKHFPRLLVTCLNGIPGLDLREYISNFYPSQKPKNDSLFRHPFLYRHPVTGEERRQTVTEIENQALQKILGVFRIIEQYGETASLADAFARINGPNLYTGIAGCLSSEMRYFNTQKDLNTLIFR